MFWKRNLLSKDSTIDICFPYSDKYDYIWSILAIYNYAWCKLKFIIVIFLKSQLIFTQVAKYSKGESKFSHASSNKTISSPHIRNKNDNHWFFLHLKFLGLFCIVVMIDSSAILFIFKDDTFDDERLYLHADINRLK